MAGKKKKKKEIQRRIAKRRERKTIQKRKAARKKKLIAVPVRRKPTLRKTFSKEELWPLHEVLVTESWNSQKNVPELVQVLVSRKKPSSDSVAIGGFLVDLACLGVKDAMSGVISMKEYRALRDGINKRQTLVPADLDLVAKIVREGIKYARSLGFEPHPDYYDAVLILGDADPDACREEVPVGWNGKPFYIAGPYDNVDAILHRLMEKLGPDGFTYLAPIPTDEVFPIGFDSE